MSQSPIDKQLPPELTADATSEWDAFRASFEDAVSMLSGDGDFVAEILRVWALSDFVSKSCIRDVDMLMDLFQSKDLFQSYQPDVYPLKLKGLLSDIGAGISTEQPKDELQQKISTLQRILRKFRRREMVRIAWRNLAGRADLQETMRDLSIFAEQCIDQTLSLLYDIQCRLYGIPRTKDGSKQHLVVFGLGKLGGRELNFSSDVDLIFAYPEAGKTDHPHHPMTSDAFFVRLCRNLVKTLSEITPDGFVFRIDLRLRPDGENGPLVMSFENLGEYYQLYGREWERYAWIKARPVAGDIIAGNNLIQSLKPFVYRRYLDYNAFESLRHMKQKISLEVKRKGMDNNIKLGPGGIREIEFFGQMFQLIRGGVVPILQNQQIQSVLDILVDEGYIEAQTGSELKAAYRFLRNVEHSLQEFSDLQTHDLPAELNARQRLALTMGFDDWELFISCLKQHTGSVHHHFSKLLASKHPETDKEKYKTDISELVSLWEASTPDERAFQNLSGIGFKHPEDILKLLDQLKKSPESRALRHEGREKIGKLIPIVLKTASSSPQPDIAVKRIIRLIDTIQRRTNYIALLLENPSALEHLIRLANASPWIISFLAKHPVLLDELIDPRTLYSPPEKAYLRDSLRRQLSKIDEDELEYQIESLCIFRQVSMLRVAAADITDVLPLMRVSDYLSDIAETILQEVVTLSWRHLVAKHGMPSATLNGHACESGFAVIAYGKLGGLELGYASDLDMVFIHAGDKGQTGGEKPVDNSQFYARLGQRVIHLLTTHTAAGRIYEIDMRLRPSGSSGLLVSYYKSFQDYQSKDAWTWEHQALLRTRAIIGDTHLIRWFNDVRKEILTRKRDKMALRENVKAMREKMRNALLKHESGAFDLKQGRGGLVDIEFIVQYLVLLFAHRYNELITYSDNVRQIQALSETGILDENLAHLLRKIYLVYRATIHRLNLREKSAKVSADTFRDLRNYVKSIWARYMIE